MSASASRPASRPERLWRLWWLPLGGQGNGLSDDGWAPIADIDAIVTALLAEFRRAGVPAYAAAVTRRPRRGASRRYHVWVGTSRYSLAEDILRVQLPALLKERRQDTRPAPPRTHTAGTD